MEEIALRTQFSTAVNRDKVHKVLDSALRNETDLAEARRTHTGPRPVGATLSHLVRGPGLNARDYYLSLQNAIHAAPHVLRSDVRFEEIDVNERNP